MLLLTGGLLLGVGVQPAAATRQPTTASPDSSLLNHPPLFPGGTDGLLRFLHEHLHYPALAARNRIEGKVLVSFWVDERGHPYGFGVLRGVGAGLDEEALRVVRLMPDWQPARVNGVPTLLQMRIPVLFRLGTN